MNKELKDYIDGIITPSDVIAKRVWTGEKVRELCENIERAVKEVYGKSSLHCYDELESVADAEQIYYFSCIKPTSTTGGYFACVYLYMENDFMNTDTYETTIEIMFSETEPDLYVNYDYDIWEGPETTIKITVEPDDWSISYTPLNDPERYPVMSGDIERIKKFVNIVNDRTWKNPDPLSVALDKILRESFGSNIPNNFGGAFCLPTLTKPHVEYKPDEFVNNEDKSICAECGGGCCKRYAGAYHPADFRHEITEEFLESLFDPAIEIPPVSIDWYENFEEYGRKGFYIRPRHVGGDEVDPSYGASCALLTPTGCSLDWDHRPWQCRMLKPEKNHVCGGPDGKLLAAEAWDPYHGILEKLYNKYNKNTFTGEKPSFSDLVKEIQNIFNEEK